MRLFIIFLMLIGLGCSNQQKTKEPSIQDITGLAMAEGEKISSAAQKALGGQLKKAISDGGPVNAVQFCNTAAYPILDTLQTEIKATIRRTSLKVRNPKNTPNEVEKEILDQLTTQVENGDTPGAGVKVLGDQFLYNKPILLDNPLCLNCHGQAGTQISSETHNLLQSLYPNDKAIDYQIGDLRGMWSILFEKKDLVDYLNR